MTFTETKWNELAGKIGQTFRLGDEELERLKRNQVAKLVAAIPFVAECENSERTSLAHLGTYMMAKDPACKIDFGHSPNDDADLLKRIHLMNNFEGGNQTVIEKGMNLLALIQLEDHQQDLKEDLSTGKYNPVASGVWDYDGIRKSLVESIQSAESPELDEVMSIDAVRGYWNGE